MPESSNRLSELMSGSGSISATPRNRILGLLADGIGSVGDFMEHKDGLLPMSILSQALGIKPIARTLNELSYGGSLGTGSGMTWKPKADTMDALMAVAPLAMATPGLVNTAAAAVGKRLEPSVTRIVNNTMAKGGKPAQLLQDLATATKSPMVVWHGSPHKFDKFDASKIGTGEGAQAYGHGLYLAESPDVARSYQDALSNTQRQLHTRGIGNNGLSKDLAQRLEDNGGDFVEGSNWLGGIAKKWRDSGQPEKAAAVESFANDVSKSMSKFGKSMDVGDGALYKVDLPDEQIAKMLDWDKPLSEQPHIVDRLKKLSSSAGDLYPRLRDSLQPFELGSNSGASVYSALASDAGITKNASKDLLDAGIPGIRYLDGGSRGAGAGSSNFVVFPGNESLLSILERNGKPLR